MNLKFNEDGWTDWMILLTYQCPVDVGWYLKLECSINGYIISSEGLVTPENINSYYWKYVCRYKVRKPLGASKFEEMLKVVDRELEST